MKLNGPLLALSLATLPGLTACTDDDSGGRPGPEPITWRVPCSSHGHSNNGLIDTSTFVNDDRKHQIEVTSVDSTGAQVLHTTRGWEGDRLQWNDVVTARTSYRTELTYDDQDRVSLIVRTDRLLDNGDSGYTVTEHYDDHGAMISADVNYNSPDVPDIHETITGDLTARQVSVDCPADQPTVCDTYVFEQADGNPAHWTVGTLDFGSDGVIDLRWNRTIDSHGLELTFQETDLSLGGVVTSRSTTQREADGTELGSATDLFDENFVAVDSYVVENVFDCPAPRLAMPDALPIVDTAQSATSLSSRQIDGLPVIDRAHETATQPSPRTAPEALPVIDRAAEATRLPHWRVDVR